MISHTTARTSKLTQQRDRTTKQRCAGQQNGLTLAQKNTGNATSTADAKLMFATQIRSEIHNAHCATNNWML